MRDVLSGLRAVFGTASPPMLFSGSGTAGLEAAVANCIQADSPVLALSIGHFGRRFAEIAEIYGARVDRLTAPDGEAIEPDRLAKALSAKSYDAVLLTHNETSTGVINPLSEIVRTVRSNSDALVLADGVSSVGAVPCDMDAIGLDVMVTASQKALMAPPGLALVVASPRAMLRASLLRAPRYYLDFARLSEASQNDSTVVTPCIPVVRALQASLRRIAAEGFARVCTRTAEMAKACREALTSAGLTLFASPPHASPTVTSFCTPEGTDASRVRRGLEERGVFVSQGRGALKDRLLRIGHMGYCSREEVLACVREVVDVIGSLAS
jgi:aspartate aminotransferase-like enzyme